MTTNPVNPRGSPSEPDKAKAADPKKFRDKIEEVRETDPDEQDRRKNKRFAAHLGDRDDAVDIAPSPSPLNTSFHQKTSSVNASSSAQKSSSSTGSYSSAPPPPSPMATTKTSESASSAGPSAKSTSAPVPSPAYSPPPTVQTSPAPTVATPSPTPLPSSQQFWGSVDVSTSSPSSENQTFTEQSSYRNSPPIPSPSGRPTQNEDNEEPPVEEESPVGGPSLTKKAKPSEGMEKSEPEPFGEAASKTSKTKKQKKTEPLESSPLEKQEETRETLKKKAPGSKETASEKEFAGLQAEDKKWAPLETKEKPGQKSLSDLPLPSQISKEGTESKFPTSGKEETAGLALPARTSPEGGTSKKGEAKVGEVEGSKEKLEPPASLGESKSDQEKGDEKEHKPGSPLIAPLTLPQFDTSIQPLVQSAVTQAAPYLRPETMALFTQMVGSIYMSTSQSGISTTEVALTSPAFKNSIFYGSTITIEKYATAPDSLNIRLTGSNDAVKTFNDNLSSLVAAFQNGNYKFRIGRIDTAYKVDKPVLSRKEKEKDSGDFKDKKQR